MVGSSGEGCRDERTTSVKRAGPNAAGALTGTSLGEISVQRTTAAKAGPPRVHVVCRRQVADDVLT